MTHYLNQNSAGRYFRREVLNTIRGTSWHTAGAESDESFLRVTTAIYQQQKTSLDQLIAEGKTAEAKSYYMTIFLAAIVLLTYGRMDMVDDILTYLPIMHHSKQLLGTGVLSSLIPYRDKYPQQPNLETISAWIQTNRDKLHWDEEKGRFVLMEHT